MKIRVRVLLLLLITQVLFNFGPASQSAAAVDNFVIKDFTVEMELGRDSEERSILRTVETITADFPTADENHGLERLIVKDYNEHSTDFKLESVTDSGGIDLPYHWSGDSLRIGEADVYVHGLNTYRITYTQRDVTRHYEDTGRDEFYWDAIGLDWRVPIEQASVRLTVAPELKDSIETSMQCYTGTSGSTDTCQVEGNDGIYTLSVQDIGQYSGVTVALGFTPGTFNAYQMSMGEQLLRWWILLTVITTVISAAVIIWLGVRAHRLTYRTAELGTIVPEYLPPKDASVAASAAVSPGFHATAAAELTDLAVRHYIQILQTRVKKVFLPAKYDIRIVKDISALREEEREILSDMFGYEPTVGKQMSLEDLKNNSSAYARFLDNDKKLKELMRHRYGLKHIDQSKRDWFSKVAKALLIFAIITLSPPLLITAIIAFALSRTLWVLSEEGLSLRRYLKGLGVYIQVAEKDRLKMLQSPEGAEKINTDDPTNPAQLVKLYEKVLPYAILFGQEKEWSKQLGEYYASTGSTPDWYSGRGAFNAAAFSSAMSSFSSSASATSASSSSGGSGGGGYSGGGGGGGGGGGW